MSYKKRKENKKTKKWKKKGNYDGKQAVNEGILI